MVIEACCGSVEEAVAAQQAGADRIELCAGLPTGGVTPSLGMIEEAKARLAIPIVVMVRPREGRADPPEPDLAAMLRDIRHAVRAGADEIITGVLDASGEIDSDWNLRFLEAADGAPVAFHRVFDMTANREASLERLVTMGFCRVLTSGGQPTVDAGMDELGQLVAAAGDRITILPGGGVRPHNAAQLRDIGCRELHFSFRRPGPGSGYGGVEDFAPDPDRIRAVRAALLG